MDIFVCKISFYMTTLNNGVSHCNSIVSQYWTGSYQILITMYPCVIVCSLIAAKANCRLQNKRTHVNTVTTLMMIPSILFCVFCTFVQLYMLSLLRSERLFFLIRKCLFVCSQDSVLQRGFNGVFAAIFWTS